MKDKNNKIISSIITIVLLAAAAGAAYAYFIASIGSPSIGAFQLGVDTVDTLTYKSVNTYNFFKDRSMLQIANSNDDVEDYIASSSYFRDYYSELGTVTLIASTAHESEYCYTVDFLTLSNNFTYTTNSQIPEIVLELKAYGTGTTGSTLGSTAYVPATYYDLTGMSTNDVIHIPTTSGGSNYVFKIKALSGETAVDRYNGVLEVINIGSDQTANMGHSILGKLVFTTVDCNQVQTPDSGDILYYYWDNEFRRETIDSGSMASDYFETFNTNDLLAYVYVRSERTTWNHEICLTDGTHHICLNRSSWNTNATITRANMEALLTQNGFTGYSCSNDSNEVYCYLSNSDLDFEIAENSVYYVNDYRNNGYFCALDTSGGAYCDEE